MFVVPKWKQNKELDGTLILVANRYFGDTNYICITLYRFWLNGKTCIYLHCIC